MLTFIVSAISTAVDKVILKSKSVQTESDPISEETLAPIKEKHRLRRQYSQVIIFSRSILPRKTEPNLKLYGETLKAYPQVKFLGITFDSQLTFKKHFEDILDRCNTRYHHLRLLANKKWRLSPSTLIQIYKQCVRPSFEYGSISTIITLDYISSAKFNGSKTSLFGLSFVYQNTSVLSCSMISLAFLV